MWQSLKRLYRKIFWSYERELEKAVGDSQSLLDIGCGYPSPIRSFSSRLFSVGVDVFVPNIKKSRVKKIHNKYYIIDALKIGERFSDKSFDCVLASDLIEHLTKEEGMQLLELMERLAKNRVIVFTPNGFMPQPAYNGNSWQEHKSGWTIDEMKDRGYHIIGINGWKPLRKRYSLIKFRPRFFWQIISDLTQLFTRRYPNTAFQILCIKELRQNL